MTPARARLCQRACRAASVFVALGGVGAAVYLAWPPPDWTPPAWQPTTSQPVSSGARERADLSELSVIWQRDLRQPLFEASAASAPVAPEPTLNVCLVGTAVEGDQRYAVLQAAGKPLVVRRVGEQIEGYEVVAVRRGWARLRNGTRTYDLTVPWYDRIRAEEQGDAD
ncbi:MAG: hypothetical protein AB1716_16060 [Planctomycetota bacterium]